MCLTSRFKILKALGWRFQRGDAYHNEHSVFTDWNDCSNLAFDILSGYGEVKIRHLEMAGWKYDENECVWRKGESIWHHPLSMSLSQINAELALEMNYLGAVE